MNEIARLGRILLEREKFDRLSRYRPYEWQIRFHNAGRDNAERLLMAANGVGKTYPGSAEGAFHATGRYPDWWQGKRFESANEGWVGSLSNEFQKDTTQKALLGIDLGENLGTGMIPRDSIVGKVRTRQAGISDVADTVKVRHVSGGLSSIRFKTYEQGWRTWQGGAPNWVWGDEQADENAANEKMIFSEIQTRIFRSGGISFNTLTPLLGETAMIRHFMYPKSPGIWLGSASWDDAPHLKEEDKNRLRATFPEHELQTRTTGIPMMGEGKVFTVAESSIKCDPFPIPNHFRRIVGLDFGIAKDHPQGVVWLALDPDTDTIYLTDSYRTSDQQVEYHASAIKKRGQWIPVAWPHDGMNRDKGGQQAEPLWRMYQLEGVNMLGMSARYDDEKGGGQSVEPIIQELIGRMKTGRFKAFANQSEWFEEVRSLHRKDGIIVAIRDDLIKATCYGTMMRRYAVPKPSGEHYISGIQEPIVGMW